VRGKHVNMQQIGVSQHVTRYQIPLLICRRVTGHGSRVTGHVTHKPRNMHTASSLRAVLCYVEVLHLRSSAETGSTILSVLVQLIAAHVTVSSKSQQISWLRASLHVGRLQFRKTYLLDYLHMSRSDWWGDERSHSRPHVFGCCRS